MIYEKDLNYIQAVATTGDFYYDIDESMDWGANDC